VSGGPGRDFLQDAEFREGQQDFIAAPQRPAARDMIDCGGGFDRAVVDREDITSDCEGLFFSFRALEEALTPTEERLCFALFERP
jgi:hypothetical protein